METPDADLLFYEEAASPLHQGHILAHEISHIIRDHAGSLELDQDSLRAIGFGPALVRRMSGRTSYTSEDEREAEVMASVIRQLMYRGREAPSSRPAGGAESWDALFAEPHRKKRHRK
ncbi:hypothetical protein G3I50_04210 [Streptomyces parvus]|uniref:Regulator component n=1 Tax=Streptomyces parvus TaxID=66428 RepID=A0A7K3RQJ4_9ACTN|nr:hypothetical protein [Streptomyces parvus]